MMQFGLVGIGAGAAAALLFASLTSGSLLSVILFYLAPLPVMIAGLGWSHWAALLAGAVGSLAIAATFGGMLVLAFVVGIGAPAWWLCYLTTLARPLPAAAGAQPTLEWYPPARLVLWAAFAGAAFAILVSLAMAKFPADADGFRAALGAAFARLFGAETGSDGAPLSVPGVRNPARFIDLMVTVVPPAAAVVATTTNVINLWLAGRVVKFSGRLPRPWPDLTAMRMPPLAAAGLGAAVALSFAGGMLAIVAAVLAASLIVAFGVAGFAVLHAITQGQASRPFLIGGVYAAVIVFGWPVLMLALLGLIETFFGLRARIVARRGRPVA